MCNKVIAATSQQVVNNVNKFVLILVNELLWPGMSRLSFVGAMLVLFAGLGYGNFRSNGDFHKAIQRICEQYAFSHGNRGDDNL